MKLKNKAYGSNPKSYLLKIEPKVYKKLKQICCSNRISIINQILILIDDFNETSIESKTHEILDKFQSGYSMPGIATAMKIELSDVEKVIRNNIK